MKLFSFPTDVMMYEGVFSYKPIREHFDLSDSRKFCQTAAPDNL